MPGWTDDQEASVPMHLVDRAKVRLHGLSIMPCSPHKSDITRIFLVAAVCGLAMQMAFASPPALALTQHPEVSTITGLSEPFQLGLDEATGDLFVASNSGVEKYEPTSRSHPGNGYSLVSALPGISHTYAVGVDNSGGPSQGDVYVSHEGSISKFDSSGSPDPVTPSFGGGASPLALETPEGLAVDPASGDIYVSDYSHNVIDVYEQTGLFVSQFPTGSGPGSVAFNSSGGDLYVVDENSRVVEEFAANGSPVNQSAGPNAGTNIVDASGNAQAVAVDPTTNNVYVDDEAFNGPASVSVFSSSGESLSDLSFQDGLTFTFGIAVDPSTGTVFLSDYLGGSVHVIQPIVVPNIGTRPVTNPGQTTETVNGVVDPAEAGAITGCQFEYVTAEAFAATGYSDLSSGGSIVCSPETPYSGSTEVSANIVGLTHDTTYDYRLVASNANGTNYGPDLTFTPHAVPGLSTEPATLVTSTTARLNGAFIGNGERTHYYFEWGETEAYGNTTAVPPGADAGSPSGASDVFSEIRNLEPLTEYHYRVVASNNTGTSVGEDQTLETSASAPLVSESVSEVHSDSAELEAQINPAREDTVYHFEVGTADCSTNPCTSTPIPNADIGSGAASVTVSAHLSNLNSGTTYDYRVIAENKTGETDGPNHTFSTFATGGILADHCPNAHVRQQTGAALLARLPRLRACLRCRIPAAMTSSLTCRRPDPLRQLPAGRESAARPLRRPRWRHPGHGASHQPWRRPLHRHARQ